MELPDATKTRLRYILHGLAGACLAWGIYVSVSEGRWIAVAFNSLALVCVIAAGTADWWIRFFIGSTPRTTGRFGVIEKEADNKARNEDAQP